MVIRAESEVTKARREQRGPPCGRETTTITVGGTGGGQSCLQGGAVNWTGHGFYLLVYSLIILPRQNNSV